MPRLTRWCVKTALIYFILALLSGILLVLPGDLSNSLPFGGLFPVYVHLLVIGWVTMLILGIVFWMFPKYTPGKPRGSQRLGWASYLLLNTGVGLRTISEPLNAPGTVWAVLLVIAAVLLWLGGMAFVANTWSRVKGK